MNGNIYRLKNLSFLCLLAVVLMSSCSVRNSSRILQYPKSFNTDTLKTVAIFNGQSNYSEYRIKPFDKISVTNLQDPELLGSRVLGSPGSLKASYEVDNNGEITLPGLSNIKVAGLNKQEATEKIQKLYGEALFKNPIIELTINNLSVTMLGAFKTEGNYVLANQKTDLIDLIGLAGGISEDANVKKIRIIRGDRANPELIIADLSNVNTLANPKLILQDGDVIIAERSKFSVFSKNVAPISSIASVGILILNTLLVIGNLK
ncbi:polysaccharide biosynthesis/export family protein [Pedobacter arcticus]|uniref:polysaccharide biosynthesis/export family protein n=1 Tax=Pedobacter arcticus TaxID=752140 RepID=UPI000366CCE9|nr:polysaccharide biosynthesis/export family protein [Pedobacter arcticus]